MRNILQRLRKDAIIYGIGGLGGKAIGILLLPVYTRIFSPADYGMIEMLAVITGLIGACLVMGMDSAQSFFFFEQKGKGEVAQAELITAIVHWRLLWGGVLVVISIVLAPWLNQWFFDGQLGLEHFAVAFAGILFVQISRQGAEIYRLLYRPIAFFTVSLGQSILAAATGLILIVGFGWGIVGYFSGILAGAVITSIIVWLMLRRFWVMKHVGREWWPRLLKFGAPFLPAGIAAYTLNASDRWFVNYYGGADELGLYALAARFAMIVMLAVGSFRSAFRPIANDIIAANDESARTFHRDVAQIYVGLGMVAAITLTVASPFLVRWLTPTAYHGSYPIVGILSGAYIAFGLFPVVAGGIIRSERTIWFAVAAGIAAVVNILLDFLMVPLYGGIGAAIATSCAFVLWTGIVMFKSEQLWKVGYRLDVMATQLAIGIGGVTLILWLFDNDRGPVEVSLATVAILAALYLTIRGKLGNVRDYKF